MSRATVVCAECGDNVGPATAQLLADKLSLKLGKPVSVSDLIGDESSERDREAMNPWRSVWAPGPFTLAPNGLQWRVQKLEHKLVPNRFGRGKFYDLGHLSSQHQHEFQGYLVARHAEVCDRVGAHPNVARNYDVFPDRPESCTWWIVDEWLEGATLESSLERGPLPRPKLKRVMSDIAAGLARLHEVGIVRRNLTPASVLVTDKVAVLTDFELARLPGNVPTVSASAQWRGNDYVAPEVPAAAEPMPSADLYSWSMVLVHAATGQAPQTPALAKNSLAKAGLPAKVTDFALSCILRPASKRPRTAEALLSVVKKWT